MQRLHVDDLAGILIEQGWPRLAIPAVAAEPADYVVGEGEVFHRLSGTLLQFKSPVHTGAGLEQTESLGFAAMGPQLR